MTLDEQKEQLNKTDKYLPQISCWDITYSLIKLTEAIPSLYTKQFLLER